MELLKLNLPKPLEWSRAEAETAGINNAPEAAATMANAPEGAECAVFWDWDALVDEQGDDGPRARRPMPSPAFTAASGLPLPTGSIPAGGGHADGAGAIHMEPGRHLFVQTRAPAKSDGARPFDDWLADTMEWFAREAWWTKTACTGRLLIRFVREDGKTAVQILRRLA